MKDDKTKDGKKKDALKFSGHPNFKVHQSLPSFFFHREHRGDTEKTTFHSLSFSFSFSALFFRLVGEVVAGGQAGLADRAAEPASGSKPGVAPV
jgi:hypothetical protein